MSISLPRPYIIELSSEHALDPAVVGSKSASVADLVGRGLTVPLGFVIRAQAFTEFIAPVVNEISELLSTVDSSNAASAYDTADSIAALLDALPLPDGLAEEIEGRVNNTPGGLAVRSSATAEDLEGASFAGMYDTFLDATDAETVRQRVRDVWASYYSGRAISYREHRGLSGVTGAMAVLVMELINADVGGVVFTRDPRDGADQILINAALGLGEGVVSGMAHADSFTLDSETHAITGRNIIDKERMLVQGIGGSTERVPVPANRRSSPVLSDDQLRTVADAATTIKRNVGDDRDIEFALLGDEVHILQSRPVTTGTTTETEFPVEWECPDQEKLYWTAGSQEPVLPLVIDYSLMASIAEKRSVDITGQYMGRRDLRKIVNGYLYSAESFRDQEQLKSRLFKHHMLGRRYLAKRTTFYHEEVEPVLLENLGAIEVARPASNAPIPDHIANLRRTMQLAADHQNDLHWRSWAGFKEKGDLAKVFSEITGRPTIKASDLTLGIDHMTARLTRRMISLSKLVKSDDWLTEVFASRNYKALFAHGNGNRHVVARFRSRFRAFMKIWGRRNGIGYGTAWKPTDPSWNMKPEIPLDSIGSYARQNLERGERSHADLVVRRRAAIRAVRKKIGRNQKLREKFEFELFRGTSHIKMMENHNYLIEQCTFGEYRESINRAGTALERERFIDTPDDIFYLRLAELEQAVRSGDYAPLRSLIIRAKEEFAENSKLTRPDFIGTKPPEPEEVNDDEAKPVRGLSEDGSILHGEPSSAGSFTGVARVVITRTASPPDIRTGEVLVTDNTGPDWVPIFPLIGGLVLDNGDNFQHAALIAREYGIPCVIQTRVATTTIANGQTVTIDGTAGTINLNPVDLGTA